ncbi:MAG: 2-dehydropantoate 2-reductase [Alphaproteobacteria bacterium]|nr:2-dehydropantoate 2-reductase [Alphaproteobacteria bacterium]
MKICVYGAGAIGGYVAARLSRAGEAVTVIARGAKLEAMSQNGLRLISDANGEDFTAHPDVTEQPSDAGPQDVVILAMKAHSLPGVAERLAPLLGPDTVVVPAVNGVPWWYFHKLAGPWAEKQIETVDPGGVLWRKIGPERVIGCVVYPAAEVVEPGVVRHLALDRMPLGEPDGSRSERALALSKAMVGAGFKSPVRPRIRDDIWIKLWGNVAFNPISMLTGATLVEIAADEVLRGVVRSMMVEAKTVAETLGVSFPIDVDRRIDGAADVGEHKTSTLQDFEAGQAVELPALVEAVAELGRMVDVPTPTIDMIAALARKRAMTAEVWPS